MNSDLNAYAGLPIIPSCSFGNYICFTQTCPSASDIKPPLSDEPHENSAGFHQSLSSQTFLSTMGMIVAFNVTRFDTAWWDLYLPKRSIFVLSRKVRYDWTHGTDKNKRDCVSLPIASSRPDTNFSNPSLSPRVSDGTWIDQRILFSVVASWCGHGCFVMIFVSVIWF